MLEIIIYIISVNVKILTGIVASIYSIIYDIKKNSKNYRGYIDEYE